MRLNQEYHSGGRPFPGGSEQQRLAPPFAHCGTLFLGVCRLTVGLVGADPGSGSLERKADFMGARERSLRPGESTIAASSHHRSRPMVINSWQPLEAHVARG
jgi:hypothetical protein